MFKELFVVNCNTSLITLITLSCTVVMTYCMLYIVHNDNMACIAMQYTNNCHCTCKLYNYHPFGANDVLWSVASAHAGRKCLRALFGLE
jgi:hypothetical protein